MANLMQQVERIDKAVDRLMKLNQDSFIRGDNGIKTVGVNWDLDKHQQMFKDIVSVRQQIEWIKKDLKHIY